MANERLAPDAILEQTNLSGAVTAIDEDPDSADASWLTASSNNAATIVRVSFPTPSASLAAGAGLQEFRVQVRKISGQSGTPQVRIELYENGSLISTPLANTNVTSTTGTVLSATWDATGRTGSLIECRVVGTQTGGSPSVRNTVEVGAIEWNAETDASGNAAPGTPTLTISALHATAEGDPSTDIAFVQEVANYTGGSAASHDVPITNAPTVGHHLAIAIIAAGNKTFTVSDSASAGSNTWTVHRTRASGTQLTIAVATCKVENALTTSDTITITPNSAQGVGVIGLEYSGGHDTWFDVDAATDSAGTAVTAFDTGATSLPAQAHGLAIAVLGTVATAGTISITDPTGTTSRGTQTPTDFSRTVYVYDKVLTSQAAQQFDGTYTTSRVEACAILVFKAAPAGGGSTGNPGTPTASMVAGPVASVGVHHVRDTFTRSVSNGLGTPDIGVAWTGLDDPTVWSVDGDSAVVTVSDSTAQNGTVGDGVIDLVNQRARMRFRTDNIPTGGFHVFALYNRRQADATSTGLRGLVRIGSGGAVEGKIQQEVGTNTDLTAYASAGFSAAANDWIWFEMQTDGLFSGSGAVVEMRVWLEGTDRPSSPTFTANTTDVAIDTGGTTGFRFQASTDAGQSFPVTVEFDDLSLIDLDGNAPAGGDGTATPGTATATAAVLAATATGESLVTATAATGSIAVLAATAKGEALGSPSAPALTAAVLAANASGAALASPLTPSLTAAAQTPTATGAALASPGTPALTIAVLAASAQGDAINYATAAQGATASASTTWQAPYLASAAIDEDDATAWASATEPTGNWLRVDLGQARGITAYRLLQSTTQGFNSTNHAATWDVQYSDNDTDWTTATSQGTYVVDTGLVTFGDVGSHRYWRVLATSDTVSGGWCVSSFELWAGSASSAGDASPGTPTLTAAVLSASAIGEALATPATPALSAAVLTASASGEALVSATTPSATAAAQAATASGAASAAAGPAAATVAAQSATAKGEAVASPGTPELTIVVLPVNAGATATGHPGTATAILEALTATATGAALTSAGTGELTIAAFAAIASGAAQAPAGPASASLAAQSPTATGAALAQPGTPAISFAANAVTTSGEAQAQPGTGSLTIEALHATGLGGGSAVAQPGTATATAAVLAASASGAAEAQPGTPSITIVVLPVTAGVAGTAQPGTPSLTASAQSPIATGQALASATLPTMGVEVLSPTGQGAALVTTTRPTLGIETLSATAGGSGQASPGAPALTVVVLPASGSGLQAATAQPGTAELTLLVIPAAGQGEALASAGLAQLTAEALHIIGAGHLLDGPIAATTRSVAYLNAETRSRLRDYAVTNSMLGLLAVLDDLSTGTALTDPRDGLAAASESEED